MWYKFFVAGRLDAERAYFIKEEIAGRFGLGRVVVDRKERYFLIPMEEECRLPEVVDCIGGCGLEVSGYMGIQ